LGKLTGDWDLGTPVLAELDISCGFALEADGGFALTIAVLISSYIFKRHEYVRNFFMWILSMM
jgi:hypothetical protein